MTPLLITLVAAGIGALAGWLIITLIFARERRNMRQDWLDIAASHEEHARRLLQPDARLGVNDGITFATNKMQQTIAELHEHIEDHNIKDGKQ